MQFNNVKRYDCMKKRTWFHAIMRETKTPSKYARAAIYAISFGLISALTLTLFTGSYNGTCYGFIFGVLFGLLFAGLSRFIARQIGEGGILWYGFAGILSGTFSGALTKIICTPIAHEVLSAVYGHIESPVQLAFYAVVCAAYLGGFFGLFQSLIFGSSLSTQETECDAAFKPEQAHELANMRQLSEPIEIKRDD